jgi:hypothetical protein
MSKLIDFFAFLFNGLGAVRFLNLECDIMMGRFKF